MSTPADLVDVYGLGRELETGHFAPGNYWSCIGGAARHLALTPERRQEIARAGWQGLVDKRFGGDAAAARDWLRKKGAWAAERAAYGGTWMYRGDLWPDPGPMPGGASAAG